jgi:hypothetical protein
VLAGLDEVGQAVAIVREDRPGDKRITAYITPATLGADGQAATLTQAIKRAAAAVLPDYMVPRRPSSYLTRYRSP